MRWLWLLGLALAMGSTGGPARAADEPVACVAGARLGTELVTACTAVIDAPATSDGDRIAALIRRADANAAKGRLVPAMADLDRAVALDRHNARAWRARGELLRVSGGDPQRALADLSEAIRLAPDDAEAFEERGVIYTNLRQFDRAIADYNEAIRLKPDNAQAFSDRGATYYFSGDYPKAISDYDEAIRLKPDSARTFTNRGAAYKKLGQNERAIADESEAIRLDPSVPEYFDNRGLSYAQQRDYDKAIADYDQAIRIQPKPNFLTNRGDAHQFKGDLNRALADYDTALRLDPKFVLAYNNRAVLFRKMGDRVKALADYEAALRIDPKLDNAIAGRKALVLEIERIGAQMPLQANRAKPSFDCATAKRAVEKTICADPELGALDHDIGEVYGRLLNSASGAAAKAARERQRAFVAARNEAFGRPDYDLKAAMQRRLEELRTAAK
jgi:tetratricopeptide (TPR) repeat protein